MSVSRQSVYMQWRGRKQVQEKTQYLVPKVHSGLRCPRMQVYRSDLETPGLTSVYENSGFLRDVGS